MKSPTTAVNKDIKFSISVSFWAIGKEVSKSHSRLNTLEGSELGSADTHQTH